GELERNAAGDHPFFAAGADEEEILLPVVEEAEVALRIALAGWCRRHRRRRGPRLARALDDGGTGRRRAVVLHETADAIERLGGDAAAVAQPPGELAVVDGAAAEGRFRKAAMPAVVGDLLQQFLRVHGLEALRFRSKPARAALPGTASVRRNQATANQARARGSTTKRPTARVGRLMGQSPTAK